MNARLVILLVLGLGAAVVLVAKRSPNAPESSAVVEEDENIDNLTPEERRQITELQKTLAQRELSGSEPVEPAALAVEIEVDTSAGKNSLCLYVSEAHGYYVETFEFDIWYVGDAEGVTKETTQLKLSHYANKYLKANDTLMECIQVVPAELADIGGDIGASEDWRVELVTYGRARLEDPDPLPPL